jgi:hypothetical protein
MVARLAPPPKTTGKGVPPTSNEPSVGNNTARREEGKDVPMNLRVEAAFLRRVKQYALDHDTSVKAATVKALTDLMDRAGTPK